MPEEQNRRRDSELSDAGSVAASQTESPSLARRNPKSALKSKSSPPSGKRVSFADKAIRVSQEVLLESADPFTTEECDTKPDRGKDATTYKGAETRTSKNVDSSDDQNAQSLLATVTLESGEVARHYQGWMHQYVPFSDLDTAIRLHEEAQALVQASAKNRAAAQQASMGTDDEVEQTWGRASQDLDRKKSLKRDLIDAANTWINSQTQLLQDLETQAAKERVTAALHGLPQRVRALETVKVGSKGEEAVLVYLAQALVHAASETYIAFGLATQATQAAQDRLNQLADHLMQCVEPFSDKYNALRNAKTGLNDASEGKTYQDRFQAMANELALKAAVLTKREANVATRFFTLLAQLVGALTIVGAFLQARHSFKQTGSSNFFKTHEARVHDGCLSLLKSCGVTPKEAPQDVSNIDDAAKGKASDRSAEEAESTDAATSGPTGRPGSGPGGGSF